VRDQVFLVQVTLNIATTQSTAHVMVSGGGAAGDPDYTMPPPFHILSPQFGAIRLWKGFGHTGSFDATNIVVTRDLSFEGAGKAGGSSGVIAARL